MSVPRTIRIAVVVASLGGLLAGCASVPPPTDAVAKAELSLRKAEQAGAAQVAPLDLRQAREKLQEARNQMNESDTAEEARRLAEAADVQAQLAEAKAIEAKAIRNREQARKSVEILRQELETVSP